MSIVVGLEEPNAKYVNKLSKKGKDEELAQYLSLIELNNNSLINALENYWDFNTDLTFLPLEEAEDKMREDREKYALLYVQRVTEYDVIKQKHPNNSNIEYRNRYEMNTISCITIECPGEFKPVYFPSIVISKAEAIWTVQQLNYILTRLNAEDKISLIDIGKECHGKMLKDKKLLMCNLDLDEDLTVEKIEELYTNDFEVVDPEVIDQALIDKDPNTVIVMVITMPGSKGDAKIHYLSSTLDGEIVGYSAPGAVFRIAGVNLIQYHMNIKEKQIKNYEKIAHCK